MFWYSEELISLRREGQVKMYHKPLFFYFTAVVGTPTAPIQRNAKLICQLEQPLLPLQMKLKTGDLV